LGGSVCIDLRSGSPGPTVTSFSEGLNFEIASIDRGECSGFQGSIVNEGAKSYSGKSGPVRAENWISKLSTNEQIWTYLVEMICSPMFPLPLPSCLGR